MLIEMYADVVCAWAFIGKRRLEAAVAELSREVPVHVVWRPFLIDPMAPVPADPLTHALADPVNQAALSQCAPGTPPDEHRAHVRDVAAVEGLSPWQPRWRASSWGAQRLLTSALEAGPAVQGRLAERLLHAHFLAGEDISSSSTLRRAAEESGLPPHLLPDPDAPTIGYARGRAETPGDRLERETREQLLRGRALGVRSSPTLVVDGRLLRGAQPGTVLADWLRIATGEPALPPDVARMRSAESLLGDGDALGALYLLEPLQEQFPADRGIALLAARALFASAQLHRAGELLEGMVAAHPDDGYAHLLLGRSLERLGRPAEAAPHLTLASALGATA